MVEVQLWAGLRRFTDGESTVRVEARNIREMLVALTQQYPGLEPIIDEGVSVAINGEIYAESVVELIPEGAEVVLLQRIRGG
ncbi:MAG: MoaD/ThiS family protein [Thalassovita sp.]